MSLIKKFITFVSITIFLFSFTSIVEGVEYSFQPSITIGEEYHDNILLDDEETIDDYITRVQPSIKFNYNAPRWDWDVFYGLDFRYYAKNTRSEDITHDLRAKGLIELINEFFFIDINDTFKRESLDVTRDFETESLFVRQSDRNIFTGSPYFVLRPSSTVSITTGYIFEDVRYDEEIGVDRRDHIGFVDTAYELSPQFTINGRYSFTQEDSDLLDYDKHDASLGLRYDYKGESHIFLTVGNSWLDFRGADKYSRIFWDAGIIHFFPAFTTSLTSFIDYIKDTEGGLFRRDSYIFAIDKTSERINYGISLDFTDYRNAVNKVLDTRSYGVNGNITYKHTPKITGTIVFKADKFEEKLENTYTRRYRPTVKLDYLLLEDLVLSFIYRHVDSSSPKIEGNNYKSNRYLVQITKNFF
jgi:hypothetical protein